MDENNPNKIPNQQPKQEQNQNVPASNKNNDQQAAKLFGFNESNPPVKQDNYKRTMIHWGSNDIEKQQKAEPRRTLSVDQSASFGTGTYGISPRSFDMDSWGEVSRKEGRTPWEISLDEYNLFKPKDYKSAKQLHHALSLPNSLIEWRNGGNQFDYNDNAKKDKRALSKIRDKYPLTDTTSDFEYNGDDDDLYAYVKALDNHQHKYTPEEIQQLKNQYNELYDWGEKRGLINNWDKLSRDDYFKEYYGDINEGSVFKFYDSLDKAIGEPFGPKLKDATKALYDIPEIKEKISYDDLYNIVSTSVKYSDSEDLASTMIMKALGWEGVDVTDIPEFDGYGVGSIVYDLKPGTYKRYEND